MKLRYLLLVLICCFVNSVYAQTFLVECDVNGIHECTKSIIDNDTAQIKDIKQLYIGQVNDINNRSTFKNLLEDMLGGMHINSIFVSDRNDQMCDVDMKLDGNSESLQDIKNNFNDVMNQIMKGTGITNISQTGSAVYIHAVMPGQLCSALKNIESY